MEVVGRQPKGSSIERHGYTKDLVAMLLREESVDTHTNNMQHVSVWDENVDIPVIIKETVIMCLEQQQRFPSHN